MPSADTLGAPIVGANMIASWRQLPSIGFNIVGFTVVLDQREQLKRQESKNSYRNRHVKAAEPNRNSDRPRGPRARRRRGARARNCPA